MRDMSDTTGQYLVRMGKHRQISHKEEIAYGQIIRRTLPLFDARTALAKKLGRQPTRSEWAEQANLDLREFDELLHRGIEARNKMVAANLRLAIVVAKKYLRPGMDMSDLIQEANLGLIRAVEKFDPSLGYKFSTYAYPWISQSIQRAIDAKFPVLKTPYTQLRKMRFAQRELVQTLNRMPTNSELAKHLGMKLSTIQGLIEVSQVPCSLNTPISRESDREIELVETLASPQDDRFDTIDQVNSLLPALGDQQKLIIETRFGLIDGRHKSLSIASTALGLSRERIRQLEKSAISRLRMEFARQKTKSESALTQARLNRSHPPQPIHNK